MAAAIWSCPIDTMLAYPVTTFVRFCHNHGLLQVNGRPQWYTVAGGARQYVRRIASGLRNVRVGDPVLEVRRQPGSGRVLVRSRSGVAMYDEVVLACHSDQALALLADADAEERAALSSVRYQANRALLHVDQRLMPRERRVWSAWNYMSDGADDPQVSVTYLLNKLQPLPFRTPLLLSLNPRPTCAGIDDRGIRLHASDLRPGCDRRAAGAGGDPGPAASLVRRRVDRLRIPRGRVEFRPRVAAGIRQAQPVRRAA
jgi:predicted NAD/FAD-binding protein